MKAPLRWGVTGSGGIACRRTIPEGFASASNARLISVYGTNRLTNQEVGARFNAIAADTLDELLRTEIDAVYIASPVDAHEAQVLACAAAGKHVLCEKPLGRNVAEAESMVAACRRAGVQLGTAFMMRFQTQHQAAAALIREGRLGKPVFGRAQLSCWYPPMAGAWRQDPARAGGGALLDLASHCIDLLEMFFGPVCRLSGCVRSTVHPYASDDSAVILLEFANGATGTVDTFFCIQDESSPNALELYGSEGSILAKGTIGQDSQGEMVAHLKSVPASYEAQQSRGPEPGIRIAPEPRNTYRAEIEAFSAAVLEGKPNPVSGKAGLRNQRLLAACYQSAKDGQRVDIPADA